MSTGYRVEVCKDNRALCQNKECKDSKVKIPKGTLRLGTWAVIEDRGSWRWKHWYLEGPDDEGSGVYHWDMLDGYDTEDVGNLQPYPEMQAKVRRVIEQGHIDSEDWLGDPEMNVLGAKGTRTNETKAKAKAAANYAHFSLGELEQKLAALTAEVEELQAEFEDAEDGKSKAKKMTKAKEHQVDALNRQREVVSNTIQQRHDETNGVDHAGEKKRKLVVVEEQVERPKKKTKKVKDENQDGQVDDKASKRKPKQAKAKSKTKKEPDSESDEAPDEDAVKEEQTSANVKAEVEVKPTKKRRGKNGVKKEEGAVEPPPEEEEVKPQRKTRGRKVKKEEAEDGDENEDTKDVESVTEAPKNNGDVKAEDQDSDAPDEAPPAKRTSKRGAKKSTGNGDTTNGAADKEGNGDANIDTPEANAPSKRGKRGRPLSKAQTKKAAAK